MAKRRGRYRMTPARRAALRKAQAASARKRRRRAVGNTAKSVGAVLGTVGASAAVYGLQYHANKAATSPVKTYNEIKGFAKNRFGSGPRVDPNAPGVRTRSTKPLRYYGRGRAGHISGSYTGTRIRSRVR